MDIVKHSGFLVCLQHINRKNQQCKQNAVFCRKNCEKIAKKFLRSRLKFFL